jgi:hypothetical protein
MFEVVDDDFIYFFGTLTQADFSLLTVLCGMGYRFIYDLAFSQYFDMTIFGISGWYTPELDHVCGCSLRSFTLLSRLLSSISSCTSYLKLLSLARPGRVYTASKLVLYMSIRWKWDTHSKYLTLL